MSLEHTYHLKNTDCFVFIIVFSINIFLFTKPLTPMEQTINRYMCHLIFEKKSVRFYLLIESCSSPSLLNDCLLLFNKSGSLSLLIRVFSKRNVLSQSLTIYEVIGHALLFIGLLTARERVWRSMYMTVKNYITCCWILLLFSFNEWRITYHFLPELHMW